MRALWWSCVLGLLSISAIDCITVTQKPSSTLETHLNSSVSIRCSFDFINARALSFKRHFDQQEVVHLNLQKGRIGKNTTSRSFEGRIHFREEPHGGEGLDITFTLSRLQVEDTDLYCCHWLTIEYLKPEYFASNGTIIIVNNYTPKKDIPKCVHDIFDDISIALSIISIPFVLCLLILSVFALRCKYFTKKFTPSRPEVSPPPRRPPPDSPHPEPHTYSYLSSAFSHEYLH